MLLCNMEFSKLKLAVENGTPIYIKNIKAELFDWSDVMEFINETAKAGGDIHLFPRLGMKLENAEMLNKVRIIKDQISNLNTELVCTAHCYISFTELARILGNHCDPDDVFFWQVIGRTKWVLGDNTEYVLEPNDMIYVPRKIYHNVIPLGPRVGISFGFEYPETNPFTSITH